MHKFPTLDGKIIDLSKPLVMGILNITPDSFYDGGKYLNEVDIKKRINQIFDEGADIIDVGAYSTRPGASFVDEKEELSRNLFTCELIRKHYPNATISIDTFRSKVAKGVNDAFGPIIINDISGGTLDDAMYDYVASSSLPYIMMHIKGEPHSMQNNPHYDDVCLEVREFFRKRIEILKEKGTDNLILDLGFGFGKTLGNNYELMNRMDEFKDFGFPILTGISRKSMIYRLLDKSPKDSLIGTTVLNTIALLKGTSIIRVHDVKEAVETVKIFLALQNK